MNVISASYGNDSTAMIQWAHEAGLPDVTVAYCNTWWAAPGWFLRVEAGEDLARRCGFKTMRLSSIGMAELVRARQGFPASGLQFCTAHLRALGSDEQKESAQEKSVQPADERQAFEAWAHLQHPD